MPVEGTHPGPQASLSRSEVVTQALFGQWVQFLSERAFDRYAQHHLRPLFPQMPNRSQLNRLMRDHRDAITAFGLDLVQLMQAQQCPYEALESTAAVTRDAKRRGVGWLPGQADSGWSNRTGWYEGFHLLLCVNPMGVITGFGFGSASSHDQLLTSTLFAVRKTPTPSLPSAGQPAQGAYVADKGGAFARRRQCWKEQEHVEVVTPPLAGKVSLHNFVSGSICILQGLL